MARAGRLQGGGRTGRSIPCCPPPACSQQERKPWGPPSPPPPYEEPQVRGTKGGAHTETGIGVLAGVARVHQRGDGLGPPTHCDRQLHTRRAGPQPVLARVPGRECEPRGPQRLDGEGGVHPWPGPQDSAGLCSWSYPALIRSLHCLQGLPHFRLLQEAHRAPQSGEHGGPPSAFRAFADAGRGRAQEGAMLPAHSPAWRAPHRPPCPQPSPWGAPPEHHGVT